jgi:2-polyprenyl-3-methyl-5-hydroxy-6-metoxy-1,4-benzoquinol methylase
VALLERNSSFYERPMISPPCPLCRSSRVEPSFKRDDIPYFTCAICSFRFSRPAHNANFENTLDEYEDAYLQYLRPDPVDTANFTALYAWMELFRPLAGATILDVGCGSGKLVRFLRSRGLNACGLEASRVLYDHFLAREAGFYQNLVEDFGVDPPRCFDVVMAFDVLEHVAEPVSFIRQLARLLPTAGHLFVSTPDVRSVAARLFGRHWHYYDRYHLSYFSRRTLEQAAANEGFQLLGFSHLGRKKSAGYLVRYLFDFIIGRRAPSLVTALDSVCVPMNLFDNMYLAFKRHA